MVDSPFRLPSPFICWRTCTSTRTNTWLSHSPCSWDEKELFSFTRERERGRERDLGVRTSRLGAQGPSKEYTVLSLISINVAAAEEGSDCLAMLLIPGSSSGTLRLEACTSGGVRKKEPASFKENCKSNAVSHTEKIATLKRIWIDNSFGFARLFSNFHLNPLSLTWRLKILLSPLPFAFLYSFPLPCRAHD
jgi:hypothetical protein